MQHRAQRHSTFAITGSDITGRRGSRALSGFPSRAHLALIGQTAGECALIGGRVGRVPSGHVIFVYILTLDAINILYAVLSFSLDGKGNDGNGTHGLNDGNGTHDENDVNGSHGQ